MEVDEALSKLGSVGRWQVVYFVALSLAVMFPAGWHMVAIVYIGYKPPHHCKIPEFADLNRTIPYENGVLSSCSKYEEYPMSTTKCDDGWTYLGDDGPTIVTKWDLVCDLGYIAQTTQTVLVCGVMVGAVLFTALSDRFGRKPVFLFSQWAMVIVGIGTALSPNIYFFCVMRFFTGALQQGILLTGFVLACELFAAKHRTFAGTIIENFWAVAWCVFPLMAFLIKNWQILQIVISLSGLFTIPLFWFLPESVLWLSANGKTRQAEQTIRHAAKMNKITMPDVIFEHAASEDGDGGEVERGKDSKKDKILSKLNIFKKSKKSEEATAKYTILDLFKNRRLTIYALIMSILWMVVTLVYYGLSLSTAQLAGNRYLNGFLNAVVEIPAYTSSYFVLKRFGRRYPLIVYHLIAGIGLLANAYLDHKEYGYRDRWLPAIIFFNMLGKFGITGSFGIVFLYAPEIFPTTLRNQALGIASLFGRVGNMLATFNSYILETHASMSGIAFGFLCIAGGLLVLFLPETLNRPLPQTIEDIEAWSKKPPPNPTATNNTTSDSKIEEGVDANEMKDLQPSQ